jgi:hypothetical protein
MIVPVNPCYLKNPGCGVKFLERMELLSEKVRLEIPTSKFLRSRLKCYAVAVVVGRLACPENSDLGLEKLGIFST